MNKDYPPILDACCGARSFWNDKTNPLAMFMDIRRESLELCDGRIIDINPTLSPISAKCLSLTILSAL